jgi:hypothetical protein
MQSAGCHAALDRKAVQTEPTELRACHNPVLPGSKSGDRLPPPRWWGFVAFSATRTHHLTKVAPQPLRVGWQVTGDLPGSTDRYLATRGARRVRWWF